LNIITYIVRKGEIVLELKYKYSKLLIASIVYAIILLSVFAYDFIAGYNSETWLKIYSNTTILKLGIASALLTCVGGLFCWHGMLNDCKITVGISVVVYILSAVLMWQYWLAFLPLIVLDIAGFEKLDNIIQANKELVEEYKELLKETRIKKEEALTLSGICANNLSNNNEEEAQEKRLEEYTKGLSEKHKEIYLDSLKIYEKEYIESISTKIVGVTFENEDGTNRQALISKLNIPDTLTNMIYDTLYLEYCEYNGSPSYKVLNNSFKTLGNLKKELSATLVKKYKGCSFQTRFLEVTGGDEGKETYGCNIEIDIYR
jgi:hypothetical protein